MGEQIKQIVYFDSEGRDNYSRVLEIARARAAMGDIDAVVVFSGSDSGASEAVDAFEGEGVPSLIVVTYRAESQGYREDEEGELSSFPIGLTDDGEANLNERLSSPVVRAPMPFSNEVMIPRYGDPKLCGIREALRLLGGGLVLVVQAVLMACDAGRLREGQRVVAFAADTAIVAISAHSDTVFFPDVGMEISEVLCKPAAFDVSRVREAPETGNDELPL